MNHGKERSPNVPPQADEKSFRIAVFAAPTEPNVLAQILEQILGLNTVDARIHAHATPGILPDHLSFDRASRLTEAIEKLGITSEVIAEDEIPRLAHPIVIHRADLTSSGLEVIELHGRTERTIPWREIELLSIGYVPLETARHYPIDATAVISAAPRAPRYSYETPTLSGPEAWLLTAGEPRAYRINHNEMNYETLGDRKVTSATQNFNVLIHDLVAHCDGIFLPPATHAFLNDGQLGDYLFRSSEELQRSTQFHRLVMDRMRKA